MWSVAQAAETLGFHARGLQLSYEALQELDLPAIVHWEGYHYIVLWEASAKGVLVGDPGIALRRLSAEELAYWRPRAEAHFAPSMSLPRQVSDLCLFTQPMAGAPFTVAERIALSGRCEA